ncbi:baseplate J/gp47 family protein [Micromonospora sp. BRA006-A]|nr:baseplate J/gp47 family protein [Micromonospora sp. BRA006-A]
MRLWYRCGGGPAGNVAAGVLTSLRDPLPGVTVDNPEPATGGRDLESLESVLARGPYEFFAQQRAVTARDFEILATGSGAVARARAFTRAAVYSFARPGEVEVVLVPYVPEAARPADGCRWRCCGSTRWRRPGAASRPTWNAVVPSVRRCGRAGPGTRRCPSRRGWWCAARRTWRRCAAASRPAAPDAQPAADAAEPGRLGVRRAAARLQRVPDAGARRAGCALRRVGAVRGRRGARRAGADRGGGPVPGGHLVRRRRPVLFRSTNAGAGWEPAGRFDDETVVRVVPAPAPVRPGVVPRAGSVAVVTTRDAGGSRVRLSTDLGETWTLLTDLDSGVRDLAWIDRDGTGALLLATDTGLYEVPLLPGAVPLQILVDPADADRGFYAVRAFVSERGAPGVAVAAQAGFGVYLSTAAGRPGTFAHVGLANVDNRVLAVQYDGPATLLWCGAGEPDPKKPGQGCHRTRLFESDVKWQSMASGWIGGTCRDLAFSGPLALAATQSGGVVRLDTLAGQPQWSPVMVNCGLPLRDRTRFVPVDAIAATAPTGTSGAGRLVLAGGERGVFRSDDGEDWTASANRATADVVTVPGTWLLCSGEHDIEVVRQDAPSGD